MTACVDALSITSNDDVLEIGFGLCSATDIVNCQPRSCTAIEPDETVAENFHKWAPQRLARRARSRQRPARRCAAGYSR
jgi:16S rRNA A1518/A1519 N6-dimethyltransferase RsmA/KsgA/DIM1 with predicted DNA glycosylase/AP lyase activity